MLDGSQVPQDGELATPVTSGLRVGRSGGSSGGSGSGGSGSSRRRLMQAGSTAPGLFVRVFDGNFQPVSPSTKVRF